MFLNRHVFVKWSDKPFLYMTDVSGPATEKRDIRTNANSEDPYLPAHQRSGQDIYCWPSQYRDLVDFIGLIAKILTLCVTSLTGLGSSSHICPKGFFVSRRPIYRQVNMIFHFMGNTFTGCNLFQVVFVPFRKRIYRIRPNYRTVRLGFSKLLGTLSCCKIFY